MCLQWGMQLPVKGILRAYQQAGAWIRATAFRGGAGGVPTAHRKENVAPLGGASRGFCRGPCLGGAAASPLHAGRRGAPRGWRLGGAGGVAVAGRGVQMLTGTRGATTTQKANRVVPPSLGLVILLAQAQGTAVVLVRVLWLGVHPGPLGEVRGCDPGQVAHPTARWAPAEAGCPSHPCQQRRAAPPSSGGAHLGHPSGVQAPAMSTVTSAASCRRHRGGWGLPGHQVWARPGACPLSRGLGPLGEGGMGQGVPGVCRRCAAGGRA